MMKKFTLIFALCSLLFALSACGVKTEPERPGNPNFPRNYPVD